MRSDVCFSVRCVSSATQDVEESAETHHVIAKHAATRLHRPTAGRRCADERGTASASRLKVKKPQICQHGAESQRQAESQRESHLVIFPGHVMQTPICAAIASVARRLDRDMSATGSSPCNRAAYPVPCRLLPRGCSGRRQPRGPASCLRWTGRGKKLIRCPHDPIPNLAIQALTFVRQGDVVSLHFDSCARAGPGRRGRRAPQSNRRAEHG